MKGCEECLERKKPPFATGLNRRREMRGILVRWPSGEVEEVKQVKLFLRGSSEPVVFDDATLFIGVHSCTIKTTITTILFPFAALEKVELERR